MLKMMETKLTARLTDSNDAIKRREGGAGGGGGGTLQQVLETQERLEGMQTKLELDVQAMDKRVMHQLQQLQHRIYPSQQSPEHRSTALWQRCGSTTAHPICMRDSYYIPLPAGLAGHLAVHMAGHVAGQLNSRALNTKEP